MDPPEEDELASLVLEAASDHGVGGGPRDAAPTKLPLRPPGRRGRPPRGGHAAAPSAGTSGGAAPSGGRGTFALRFGALLVALVGIVALVLFVDTKTEKVIEEGTEAGNKVVVHHNITVKPGDKLRVDKTGKITAFVGGLKDKMGASSGGGGAKKGSVAEASAGFHDPSPENIYGANRYYKPKGAGYPIRPTGGLHPIYMVDVEADAKLNEGDFDFDDDFETSPYADKRLKMTDEERKTEQEEWSKKLQDIRDKYGYWDFKDDYKEKNKKARPVVDWATVGEKKAGYDPLLGEIDKDDFPKDAWQTDDEYVTNFLKEGKKLVKRVLDGIYEEYGQDEDETKRMGVSLEGSGGKKLGGQQAVAWMHEDSFHALAKKLLNAMITNDHFFVTLGGHSAAAGHGNNFHQSYMMEFQRVMEPVFDRLGMVLVSANRAQGGMGTLQSALGGKGIYGQNDFVLWDSSMTEKDQRAQDVFGRQALLSGMRAPILFDMGGGRAVMDALHKEAGAHVGGVAMNNMFPKYKHTEFDFNLPEHKFNAKCWTERSDVEVDVQYDKYGGQASWHPGNFVHQSTARKISLVFLHALDEALTRWETAASEEGNPLDGKHWHLHAEEEKIRDALKSVNATTTKCGQLFPTIPRMCTVGMNGVGEWAPRHDAYHSSIRGIAKPAANGYIPAHLNDEEQAYPGRDPKIPSQRVPKGEVDIGAIARSLPPRSRRKRRLSVDGFCGSCKWHNYGCSQRVVYLMQNYKLSQEEAQGALVEKGECVNPDSKAKPSKAENAEEPKDDATAADQQVAEAPKDAVKEEEPKDTAKTEEKPAAAAVDTSRSVEAKITPGLGWAVENHPAGYCDGTSNALCYRGKTFHCLLSGHNDARGIIKGDALSGWLVLNLKDMKEGIVMSRMEPWTKHNTNAQTNGWTTVNNGADESRRRLKGGQPLHETFTFEVAVNGVIQYSKNTTQFGPICTYPGYNNAICILWDDPHYLKNEVQDIEFAMRVTGAGGRAAIIGITHLYWA